ncbi:hypothetical protein SAMD00079811_14160 [Scytonema sp. HK-05]|uniref:hypothetical protein n=1 Tax=Scytonema sp. HK-05 TaxID=1137095 RepID=UPI000936F8A0|nr:hypothetical protein [Scytonema sp. HK-05]OKH48579.1 hypothetical protein NIES2130_35240 [Scytonema sp. HK-05]BAY43829.1 hypothetical protein SAMD00079811_14160 [Scytonema sp. HK-05]
MTHSALKGHNKSLNCGALGQSSNAPFYCVNFELNASRNLVSQRISVPTGSTAYFNNAVDIHNIISLSIETGRLIVRDRAQVSASTFGGKSALTHCRLQIVAGESQIYQAIVSSDIAISKITHIPM